MTRSIEDEGMHPAGQEESWQESCVLSFRDAKIGISANLHMGCEIHRGISNVMVGVYRDYANRYYYNADDLPLTKVTQGHGLCSGPLTVVHDGEHLRALVDTTECKINLIVTDLREEVESPVEHDKEFQQQVAKNHFNVECKVDGFIVLDGERFEVCGLGHRDHSYGPRTHKEGDSVMAYRWLAGGIPGEMTFSLFSHIAARGDFSRHGWIKLGDVRHEVKHQTTIQMLEDGISASGAQAVCELDNGDTVTINYTIRGDGLMRVRELHNVMSMGDITLDDGRKGYATLEYVESPTQGVKLPLFSLGVAIENGLSQQPEARGGSLSLVN